MDKITISDIAKQFGITKKTVATRARELGIYDQMKTIDARGTRVMTSEQASILSDELTKKYDQKAVAKKALPAQNTDYTELQDAWRELVNNLRTENERLRAENERMQIELQQAHAAALEIATTPFWQRRRALKTLLPAPKL